MFPSPVVSGFTVIDWVWPAVGNGLSWIWLIKYFKFRFFLADLIGQFFNCKTDCSEIIGESVLYFLCWSLHDIDSGFDCVVNIHHWKTSFLLYETCVFALKNAIVENGHSVVGCSSSWLSFPTDDSWVSDTSNVQTIFSKVISSQHFSSILCDPIHSCWLNGAMLWCTFFWSCGTKNSHWTGTKNLADFKFNCNVKDIFIRNEVHIPAKFWILFSCCRQNSSHMIDLCNFMFQAYFLESLFVCYITFLQYPIEVFRDVSMS